MLNKSIKFLIENKLVAVLLLLVFMAWGVVSTPFNWDTGGVLPTNPVAVDAIPDIGENQQIVFTKWPGRSPQDIEDQITYPLTTSLLGIPGVKTIRSSSMFGFSRHLYHFRRGCRVLLEPQPYFGKTEFASQQSIARWCKPCFGTRCYCFGPDLLVHLGRS